MFWVGGLSFKGPANLAYMSRDRAGLIGGCLLWAESSTACKQSEKRRAKSDPHELNHHHHHQLLAFLCRRGILNAPSNLLSFLWRKSILY